MIQLIANTVKDFKNGAMGLVILKQSNVSSPHKRNRPVITIRKKKRK